MIVCFGGKCSVLSSCLAVSVKRLKRRIFQLAENTADWANAGMTRTVAHDHTSKLISASSLPQPLEIKVPYTDEDEGEQPAAQQKPKGGKPGGKKGRKVSEYVLTIKFVQELETESLLKYVFTLFYTYDDMGRYKASEGSIHAKRSGPSVFSPQTRVSSRDLAAFAFPYFILFSIFFLLYFTAHASLSSLSSAASSMLSF